MDHPPLKTTSERSEKSTTKVSGKPRSTKAKVYVVEEILDSRIRRRGNRKGKEYLLKWLGYPVSENSWESAHRILNKELLAEFDLKHDGKIKKNKVKKTPNKNRMTKKNVGTEDATADEVEFDTANGADVADEVEFDTANGTNVDDEVDEEVDVDTFIVEKVQGVRENKYGEKEYFVKWVGYSEDENTWEPETYVPKGPIAEFESKMQ